MPSQSLTSDLVITRRNQNATLLSIAKPSMQELSAMVSTSIVCLTDGDGYALEVLGNTELLPVGTCCQEPEVANNCIGKVLAEGQPVEINGNSSDHGWLHGYNSVAAPIYNNNSSIIGVIAFMSPLPLPKGMLQTINFVAKGIETELSGKLNLYDAIDYLQCGLFIINEKGIIANVNKKCQQLLDASDRSDIIGRPLGHFVSDEQLLLKNLVGKDFKKVRFEIRTGRGVLSCTLQTKHKLHDSDLILFSFAYERKESKDNSPEARTQSGLFTFKELVGKSDAWSRVKELGVKAARVTSNVLIVGESGTGKEMIAQAIHNASSRNGPFVPINCGAIPKELLQSELFGYEYGSFTGARKGGSEGKFEIADGGTVFLDEIGEMPTDMQVSLLRFLQDKTLTRVGGTKSKKVDVRVIAATNRDLEEAVRTGDFREDLYYRLNVINIKLPPLRQRKEDINLLVDSIVKDLCYQLKRQVPRISNETLEILNNYDWPGNVRELRNVLEFAVELTECDIITPDCLPQRMTQRMNTIEVGNLKSYELSIIQKTLLENNGNISKTAKALGITRSTLYKKIQQINYLTREKYLN